MDIKLYEFPKTSVADFILPTAIIDKNLLKEAKKRGFYKNNSYFNNTFKELNNINKIVTFKKDIDSNFKKSAWSYCLGLASNLNINGDEKEAIGAMLLSELIEIPEEKNVQSKKNNSFKLLVI